MEYDILQFIQNVTWAGVVGMFIWLIAAPTLRFLLKRNGNNKALIKVEKFENNDLHEIRKDIREIKAEQIIQGKKIARLEAIINNKK